MPAKLNLNFKRLLNFTFILHVMFAGYVLWVTRYFEYRNMLYSGFLFYFDSSYAEFELWFPRHHILLFVTVWCIKIGIAVAGIAFTFLIYRNRQYIYQYTHYNFNKHFKPVVFSEGLILLSICLYCITVYLTLKNLTEVPHWQTVQIIIAQFFLFHLLAQAIAVIARNFNAVKSYLSRYLLEPGLPYNLSILRILFFSYLITIYNYKLTTVLPTVSLTHKVGLPYIGWLVEVIPVNASLYTYACYMGIFVCIMIALGMFTRVFLVTNALLCFYIIATPNFFGKLWHEQLIIWISWFFTFSRCYDVFSFDALRLKTAVEQRPEYTFPVRLFWLQLGIIYFCAGFYKLWESGFEWALGDSMINQVQLEWVQNYNRIPAFRIDQYPWLLNIGGLGAILFELCYPILVLRKTWRWLAVVGGLAMHNFIGVFMYISFFGTLQVFYIAFFNFNVFFRKKEAEGIPAQPFTSKPAFYFITAILSLNFLCGMLSIDTYPFSAYPKYAVLIPDSLKIIQFKKYPENDDAFAIGKDNGFSWESYGWLEYNMIRDFEAGNNVQQRLEDYWEIWSNHNPQLAAWDTVNAYLIIRPVAPEGRNKVHTITKMGTVVVP